MKKLLIVAAAALALSACAATQPHYASTVQPGNEQERHACAQMGIAPGTGQFSRCVSNLDQTLTDDSRVGQG